MKRQENKYEEKKETIKSNLDIVQVGIKTVNLLQTS